MICMGAGVYVWGSGRVGVLGVIYIMHTCDIELNMIRGLW